MPSSTMVLVAAAICPQKLLNFVGRRVDPVNKIESPLKEEASPVETKTQQHQGHALRGARLVLKAFGKDFLEQTIVGSTGGGGDSFDEDSVFLDVSGSFRGKELKVGKGEIAQKTVGCTKKKISKDEESYLSEDSRTNKIRVRRLSRVIEKPPNPTPIDDVSETFTDNIKKKSTSSPTGRTLKKVRNVLEEDVFGSGSVKGSESEFFIPKKSSLSTLDSAIAAVTENTKRDETNSSSQLSASGGGSDSARAPPPSSDKDSGVDLGTKFTTNSLRRKRSATISLSVDNKPQQSVPVKEDGPVLPLKKLKGKELMLAYSVVD